MFTLKQAVVLALVGCTYASPIAHWGGYHRQSSDGPVGRIKGSFGYGDRDGGNDKIVVVVGTKSDDVPTTTAAAPAATTTVVASGSSGSTGSGSPQTGYMATVATWRSKMGLPAFTESPTLVANALDTAKSGGGKMVHKLNPGSFGQVLAPGNANNFESVFVGGWLCELPNMKGMNGVCPQMSKGWSHDGQTGHAEILSSTKYTQIGCALALGIWACDVK